jgi:hypothetical protein
LPPSRPWGLSAVLVSNFGKGANFETGHDNFAVAAVLVAGCGGGGDDDTPAELPPAKNGVIPVATMAEAESLCERAQNHPPEGETQITFDLPNTGSDLTCMLR